MGKSCIHGGRPASALLNILSGVDPGGGGSWGSGPSPLQVRANLDIWERPPLRVHSLSMEQPHYMGRPERSG